MSDSVLITLIIALGIVVILFMFRRQLQEFFFKANKDGVEARLRTQKMSGTAQPKSKAGKEHEVNISGNKQIGRGNKIDVGVNDTNVSDNEQVGQDQRIQAKSPSNTPKRK
jgi:hypothetical protein